MLILDVYRSQINIQEYRAGMRLDLVGMILILHQYLRPKRTHYISFRCYRMDIVGYRPPIIYCRHYYSINNKGLRELIYYFYTL